MWQRHSAGTVTCSTIAISHMFVKRCYMRDDTAVSCTSSRRGVPALRQTAQPCSDASCQNGLVLDVKRLRVLLAVVYGQEHFMRLLALNEGGRPSPHTLSQ